MAIIYNFNSYYEIKKEREKLQKGYEEFINDLYPKLTEEDTIELYNADDFGLALMKVAVKYRAKDHFLIAH